MIRCNLALCLLAGLLVVPATRAGADDDKRGKVDGQKGLQGVWYKLPAADKPEGAAIILRFHGERLVICEVDTSGASSGSGAFKLREKDGQRLIVQPDFFDDKKETVIAEYSLDGDSLKLTGGPSKIGLVKFAVAGSYKRAK